jgi:hypothetical protein
MLFCPSIKSMVCSHHQLKIELFIFHSTLLQKLLSIPEKYKTFPFIVISQFSGVEINIETEGLFLFSKYLIHSFSCEKNKDCPFPSI